MFLEEVQAAAAAAAKKISLMKNNPLGFVLSSMLAGMYVGIGILLIFTIGGVLGDSPMTRIGMGLGFGIALSLVVIAGAELFTGNNLVLSLGFLKKKVSLKDMLIFWLICYLGNWVGSILLGALFSYTGLASGGVGDFIVKISLAKTGLDFVPLLVRGILCNVLVCLATWCSIRCKSESGKLIMIFWCLFAFITTGLEHSIANMTLLTIGKFLSSQVSWSGYFYNILVVSLGNMIGGIGLLALPYYLISSKEA